jgi:hypothetical protein
LAAFPGTSVKNLDAPDRLVPSQRQTLQQHMDVGNLDGRVKIVLSSLSLCEPAQLGMSLPSFLALAFIGTPSPWNHPRGAKSATKMPLVW